MSATPDSAAPTDADDQQPGLLEHALGAAQAARLLVADAFGLIGLEARLAGLSLAGIVVAAIAAAFALMAFWLLGQAALVVALTALDLPPALMLLALAVFNLLLAALLLVVIRRLSRNLMFKATGETLLRGRHEP